MAHKGGLFNFFKPAAAKPAPPSAATHEKMAPATPTSEDRGQKLMAETSEEPFLLAQKRVREEEKDAANPLLAVSTTQSVDRPELGSKKIRLATPPGKKTKEGKDAEEEKEGSSGTARAIFSGSEWMEADEIESKEAVKAEKEEVEEEKKEEEKEEEEKKEEAAEMEVEKEEKVEDTAVPVDPHLGVEREEDFDVKDVAEVKKAREESPHATPARTLDAMIARAEDPAITLLSPPSQTPKSTKRRKLTPAERAERAAALEAKKAQRIKEREEHERKKEEEKAAREAKKAAELEAKEKRKREKAAEAERKRELQAQEAARKAAAKEAKAAERERKRVQEEEEKKLRLEKKEQEKKAKEEEIRKKKEGEMLAAQKQKAKLQNMWANIGVNAKTTTVLSQPGRSQGPSKVSSASAPLPTPSAPVAVAPKPVSFDDIFPPFEADRYTVMAPIHRKEGGLPSEAIDTVLASPANPRVGQEWLRTRAISKRKGKGPAPIPTAPAEEIEPSSPGPRFKLIQFHDNLRPAYWGTWKKKSKVIRPRRPLSKDMDQIDYEFDSDEEWEEEEPGEDLSDTENNDKESEDGDDAEEDDPFVVPDGYLSADEHTDGEEEGVKGNEQLAGLVPITKKAPKTKGGKNGYTPLVSVSVGPSFEVPQLAAMMEKCDTIVQKGGVFAPDSVEAKALEGLQFHPDTPAKWAAEVATVRLMGRVQAMPLQSEPIKPFYEGMDFWEPLAEDGTGKEKKENAGSPSRPIPDDLVPALARLVHGSGKPREKLVKEFQELHPEWSKTQIDKKIQQIAVRVKGESRYKVHADVCVTAGLEPTLPPVDPFSEDMLIALCSLLHGATGARDKLSREFWQHTKDKEQEIPLSQITKKWTEVAVREKRESSTMRWYIKNEIITRYNLHLPLPPLLVEEKEGFPEALYKDLVGVVHGSTGTKDKIVREFHQAMKEKGHDVPLKHIKQRVGDIAVREKREPYPAMRRWFVRDEVLADLGLPLTPPLLPGWEDKKEQKKEQEEKKEQELDAEKEMKEEGEAGKRSLEGPVEPGQGDPLLTSPPPPKRVRTVDALFTAASPRALTADLFAPLPASHADEGRADPPASL